jgi:hypothetical protein
LAYSGIEAVDGLCGPRNYGISAWQANGNLPRLFCRTRSEFRGECAKANLISNGRRVSGAHDRGNEWQFLPPN